MAQDQAGEATTRDSIDAETLERMARMARVFPGRTISVREDRARRRSDVEIDGVSATGLFDGLDAR